MSIVAYALLGAVAVLSACSSLIAIAFCALFVGGKVSDLLGLSEEWRVVVGGALWFSLCGAAFGIALWVLGVRA